MRYIVIILLFLSATYLHAQERTSIFLGDGSGTPVSGPADSMGLVVPQGEIVIGTGSKAPGSSDSLYWSAGLVVDAPVIFSGLPNLTESAGDSVLLINTSGSVFKSVLGSNFFTSNGTANGHRTHDFNDFILTMQNISQFNITSNLNWGFGTTANDIKINGLTGLGISIATTGATNSVFVNSGNDLMMTVTDLADVSSGRIILDAPDIFLEDPLTLSTWDSILVRHPVTGEIQARLASTIAGSDSLGRNGTAGQIVFETATKAPNSDAGLFWDNSSKTLIIDGTSGTSSIQMQNAEYLGAKDASGTAKRVFGISVANHVYLGAIDDVGGDVRFREDGADVMGFSGARVGIGTVAPAASAKLEISSTTQGLLPPRMTGTQRDAISSPAEGLILFNSSTSKLQVRAGGAWVDLH